MKTNRVVKIIWDGIERYFPTAIARRTALLFLIGGILALLIIPEMFLARAVQDQAVKREKRLTELTSLGKEYRSIKERVDAIQKKSSLTRVNGITASLDSLITALGMKSKLKTVKSIGSRDLKETLTEEKAEILLEGITMNEMVNLFAEINTAPVMLSVKKAHMRKTFESPEHLNVSITIALYTPVRKKPDA